MTEPTVWMRRNDGEGEPQEFEARPEVIVPRMIAGWSQCEPTTAREEVNANVDD
jgi:hypothetical protein